VGPDCILSTPRPLARSSQNPNSWVLCRGGPVVPIYPQPIPLVLVPPERRRRLPKRVVEGRAWGVFSAVAASSLGVCAVALRTTEARANSIDVELSIVAPIDLPRITSTSQSCSVITHHMKHAPINLAWNYQLSRQLIWRGSKALRRAASHNELLLCRSTPHCENRPI